MWSWLKLFFAGGKPEESKEVEGQLALDSLQDSLSKTLKVVRRLQLGQQELVEGQKKLMSGVNQQSSSQQQLLTHLSSSKEVSFSRDQLLTILDEIDALCLVEGLEPAPAQRLRDLLLEPNGWRPIAQIGCQYDSVHAQVVATEAAAGVVAGTVVHVVEQGYFDSISGQRIRSAKVAVAKQPATHPPKPWAGESTEELNP